MEQVKITDSMRETTSAVIRKIAAMKIAQHHLDCTVDEYIVRCTAKTLADEERRRQQVQGRKS